jgi:hypothetical protein
MPRPRPALLAVYTAALASTASGSFDRHVCQATPACRHLFAALPDTAQFNTLLAWTQQPGDALQFLNRVADAQRAGSARFPLCGSASAYLFRDHKLTCACATAQADFLDDRDHFGSDCDPLGPAATSASLVFALVCVLLFQTLLLVQNTQK